jgi:hypothetical protein
MENNLILESQTSSLVEDSTVPPNAIPFIEVSET